MPKIKWDIRREGRAWGPDEALDRLRLLPEKAELIEGKLFWSEEDRITTLGLLLEQAGVDQAVRMGDPAVWKAAIAALHKG